MRRVVAGLVVGAAALAGVVRLAHAGAAELEVYTDKIEAAGSFDVELLTSRALSGSRSRDLGEGDASPHTFEFTPELEFGLGHGTGADLYVLLSHTNDDGWRGDGAEFQLTYVHRPRGPARWFWGAVGEVAWLSDRISESGALLEVRPVVGWRGRRWLFALNPTIEFPLGGAESHRPEAEPAAKVSYAVSPDLSIGVEHYSELGEIGHMEPRGGQTHVLFGVIDARVGEVNVNAGVGRGLTGASPGWVVKAVVELDLD